MAVSSTSMKGGRMTARAISQGLQSGHQSSIEIGLVWASGSGRSFSPCDASQGLFASVTVNLFPVFAGDNLQSEAQNLKRSSRNGEENNRGAIHELPVRAGRIRA